MDLGLSPWTGNRYAFTGGNPITGIELDGHIITEFVDVYESDVASGWDPDKAGLCLDGSIYECSQNYLAYYQEAQEIIGSGEPSTAESIGNDIGCTLIFFCRIVDTAYSIGEASAAVAEGELGQAAIIAASSVCLIGKKLCRTLFNRLRRNSDELDAATSRWTRTEFRGNRVYQRNDLIDPERVDPDSGLTNLELMQGGRAPLGPDGRPINLHHMLQTQGGPIAEVTQTMHQNYTRTLHINPRTVPSGINRSAFDAWRKAYWMQRAKDFG